MRLSKRWVLAGILGLLSLNVSAFSLERYVEGVHYTKVEGAAPLPNTVTEFFSFGCPHCYRLEPHMEEWLKTKPADVTFNRVPATWNKKFQVLAQLYYVLEELNMVEESMMKTFDYIHKQGRHIHNKADATAFLKTLGVADDKIDATWNADSVKAKVRGAGGLFAKNQVRGVPALLVNGQYQTSVSMAGSEQELFDVIRFLLSK